MDLRNHVNAFRYVMEVLPSLGFRNLQLRNVTNLRDNKSYHCIIRHDKGVFYCLFKRDFFMTYPQKYKLFLDAFPDLNGAGESVNVDVLDGAMENNQLLLFVYPDGKIYIVSPSKIFDTHLDAKKYYPDGLYRSQDKSNDYKVAYSNGQIININECTCSFPIKILSRLY